jgi:hypothetical protein
MHFLIAASDYVEFEKPTAPVVNALDLRIGEVVRPPPDPMRTQYGEVMTDWLPALDPLLVANLVRYRQYPYAESCLPLLFSLRSVGFKFFI